MDHHCKIFKCAVLILALTCCFADQNAKVCKEAVDYSCGPVPPVLPETYMMFYEEADLDKKTAFWFEDFFDFKNLRIKRETVARGHEYHKIADYKTEQVVSYQKRYPGPIPLWDVSDLMSCTVQDIRDSEFGYRKGNIMAPHRMYTSNLAIKYGGPYTFAFDNTTRVIAERGVGVDAFTGCVYDSSDDSTATVTVAWSSSDVVTASGETPTLMRIEEHGGKFTGGPNAPQWEEKNTIKEVAWFLGDVELDENVFSLPRLMHCRGMLSTKELPKIPRAYSVRTDITFWTEEFKGDSSVIYDNSYQYWVDEELKVVRTDIYPSMTGSDKVVNVFKVNEALTAVLDFNTGLAYVSVHRTRACKVHEITAGFPFMSPYTRETPIMASAESLFEIDSDTAFIYKGQRVVRGILCDIWSANKTSPETPPEQGVNIIELAFAANDWRSAADEIESTRIPIQLIELHTQKGSGPADLGLTGSTAVINFFKFKGTSPPLSVYDIGECFFHHSQRYFIIQFPGKYRDNIEVNLRTFMDEVQFAVMLFGDLGTFLRVQDLEYMFSSRMGRVSVAFALLEMLPHARYSKGVPLSKAIENLKYFIDNEEFLIPLTVSSPENPSKTELLNITAVQQSFMEVTLPAQSRPRRSVLEFQERAAAFVPDEAPVVSYSDANDSEPSGYTPGAVAGMAIGMLVLGLVAGVAGMIFYLRRSKPAVSYSHELK